MVLFYRSLQDNVEPLKINIYISYILDSAQNIGINNIILLSEINGGLVMWTRKELKAKAMEVLRVSYWKAFLVSLIIAFVGGNTGGTFNFNRNFGNRNGHDSATNLISPGIGIDKDAFLILGIIVFIALIVIILVFAFRILLGYPLEVGGRRYFTQSAQDNFDLNALGFSFDKKKYLDIVKTMLWRSFLNFLWYLLLIIPGIVKSYAYRMVPYILTDNPNIGYKRAVELSKQMTDGEKLNMWVLDLSFIGWYLLGALFFLVGMLFIMPYENATKAELYLVLRQKALDAGLTTHEELTLTY